MYLVHIGSCMLRSYTITKLMNYDYQAVSAYTYTNPNMSMTPWTRSFSLKLYLSAVSTQA